MKGTLQNIKFLISFSLGGGGVQAYKFGNFDFEILIEREDQDTSQLF